MPANEFKSLLIESVVTISSICILLRFVLNEIEELREAWRRFREGAGQR